MALGVRQLNVLQLMAARPDGSMTMFQFMGELGRSEASADSLFEQGLVMGTRDPRGKVTLTQAGRDALSPPIGDPFGLG